MSLSLVVLTDVIHGTAAVALTLIVALCVAWIGLAQLWAHAEVSAATTPNFNQVLEVSGDHLPAELSRLQALLASWQSMKTWIKIWLFYLNFSFLAAFFFWPSDFSQIVLAAYVASGPLLLAIMIPQRGLTRFLGIAHLIPWTPLVGYLGWFLGTTSLQDAPSIWSYAAVLLASLLVCLGFDIYDLRRWMRGDRARIGSLNSRHQNSPGGLPA